MQLVLVALYCYLGLLLQTQVIEKQKLFPTD